MFFPLTRAILGYFARVYPNGQSWFPTFICYITSYHDLSRSASILDQTWEAFDDIVPFRGTLEDSPMRPPDLRAEDLYVMTFEYDNGKAINKEATVPQRCIGRISGDSLVESPNLILWFNVVLMETFNIGLLQLKREKQGNTKLWNEIKTCYMFPGERRSPTYTPELANKHLREVAKFCGFGDRIEAMLVAHSSCRGGGANETAFNVGKGA